MPQFTAGASIIAENKRKFMDPSQKLERLRDISEEDVVRLLAHRAPGEAYKSIHPPIEEMEEPECSVREMVKPTPGAAAGDRIRYVQFTDSLHFAPTTPRIRAMMWYTRYRGIDPGVMSGRTIIEARERDVEKISKEFIDNETFDTARTGLRGRSVHGHSVRLDECGVMFDALRRWAFDERTGDIKYVKDMVGGTMDKEVVLGRQLPEEELKKRTTMFRNAQGGVWMEGDDPEVADVISEIHWNRTWGGFQPFIKREQIKGNKDVGIKRKKLYSYDFTPEEEEELRHLDNIHFLAITFRRTDNLKPEEMLSLLEGKKYAMEKERRQKQRYGNTRWEVRLKEINEVEEEYFRDVLPIPENINKLLLEQPPLPMDKAKKLLIEFVKIVDECGLDESVQKSFIQKLDFLMTPR